ncbi:MAG: tol-pal system protein YbgF [Hyphomicrobium sp.]
MARRAIFSAAVLMLSFGLPTGVVAQQQPAPAATGGGQAAPAAPASGAARVTRTPPKDATAAAAAAGQPGGGDAALRKRIEQLEEQLVDLQVVIGTLESLAKQGAGAAGAPAYRPPAGAANADLGRIDGLETQIRALTQQLEQLAAEVRGSTAAARGGNAASLQPDAGVMAPPQSGQFGSTSVAPATDDPIGGILANPPLAPSDTVAALPPQSEDPKAAYEQAYGMMLQQDYGAAQAGFGDFLRRFPSHALVPNALYWLGETYYVQRNYSDAAEAFDIVLSAHAASNKAPDSQLKKAMSLSQLGKSADACSALRQLSVRYPNAPAHVKSKADSERRRVGCT